MDHCSSFLNIRHIAFIHTCSVCLVKNVFKIAMFICSIKLRFKFRKLLKFFVIKKRKKLRAFLSIIYHVFFCIILLNRVYIKFLSQFQIIRSADLIKSFEVFYPLKWENQIFERIGILIWIDRSFFKKAEISDMCYYINYYTSYLSIKLMTHCLSLIYICINQISNSNIMIWVPVLRRKYEWQIYAINKIHKRSKIYFSYVLLKHIAIKRNVLLRLNYL